MFSTTLMDVFREILSQPVTLFAWIGVSLVSLAVLMWDLREHNAELGSLMKYVWGLTTLYSGPLGLAVYCYTGRKQIRRDSIWRKGWRSTSHCYSGCGAGEILGIVLTVGILAVTSNIIVALVTFSFAYLFGMVLTVGPLLQEGVGWSDALRDAFYSETASIVFMEAVAIGVDIWVAGEATVEDVLFWTSLLFSLTMGLLAAYPVNVLLIKLGVKEGMMNPRMLRSDVQPTHG
jgi:hypothetical protein